MDFLLGVVSAISSTTSLRFKDIAADFGEFESTSGDFGDLESTSRDLGVVLGVALGDLAAGAGELGAEANPTPNDFEISA